MTKISTELLHLSNHFQNLDVTSRHIAVNKHLVSLNNLSEKSIQSQS